MVPWICDVTRVLMTFLLVANWQGIVVSKHCQELD